MVKVSLACNKHTHIFMYCLLANSNPPLKLYLRDEYFSYLARAFCVAPAIVNSLTTYSEAFYAYVMRILLLVSWLKIFFFFFSHGSQKYLIWLMLKIAFLFFFVAIVMIKWCAFMYVLKKEAWKDLLQHTLSLLGLKLFWE